MLRLILRYLSGSAPIVSPAASIARREGSPGRIGDDRVGSEKGVEPAMAGIPSGAVQRMPLRTSPGLPPVDPVKRASPVEIGSRPPAAEQPAARDGQPGPPPESSRPEAEAAPHVTIAAIGRAADVQAGTSVETRQGVAPENTPDPCADPSAGRPAPGAPEGTIEGSPFEVCGVDRYGYEPPLPFILEAYEHSSFAFDKEMPAVPSAPEEGIACHGAVVTASPAASPDPAVDSRSRDRLARARTPAEPSRRIPPRVAARPSTEEWADDELLTLPEAAALFWPGGPITTNTLRTAERDGSLTVTKVAGKFFTTPMAIRRMGVDEVGETAIEPDRAEATPQAMFQTKLAEAKRVGRNRMRPRRGAK